MALRRQYPVASVMVMVIAALVMLSGCTQSHLSARPQPHSVAPPAIDSQIDPLLKKYGLHRAAPTVESTRTEVLSSMEFDIYAEVSKAVGFDLTPFRQRPLGWASVKLRETSNGTPDNPSAVAYFPVDRGKVVGAVLFAPGYIPGAGALSDHYMFAVQGMVPTHLVFDGVRQVDVVGPWNGHDWAHRATLDSTGIARVLAMLRSSELRAGDESGVLGDEEYMLVLRYDDGITARVSIVTKRKTGKTFVSYELASFHRTYFVPPASLKPFVKSVLAAST
jgi:hypothetical protein